MRKLITVTLLSIFFSTFLKAEIVDKVQIAGNKRVSDETVMIYGDINLGKDYSEQDLNKVLNNLYSTNFFEDVKLELNNGSLKINLIEFSVINKQIVL
jgi:outer membrane protein insertion porin family